MSAKKETELKSKSPKDIIYSTISDKKSKELNEILDEIVETLNGMGEAIKKKSA